MLTVPHILTLVVGLVNFLLFTRILLRHFYLSKVESLLIGLLFLFNHLNFYSLLANTADTYALFFLLVCFEAYLNYKVVYRFKYFLLCNLAILFGLLINPLFIVVGWSLAFTMYFCKKYSYALAQLVVAVFMLLFLPFKFVPTQSFSSVLVYLAIFIYPFIFVSLLVIATSLKRFLYLCLALVASYFLLSPGFPNTAFPYFNDVLTSQGFNFTRNMSSFTFINYSAFYLFLEFVGKIGAILLFSLLAIHFKKLLNFFGLFGVLYTLYLVLFVEIADMHLLPLVPSFILFFVSITPKFKFKKIRLASILLYLIVTGLFSFILGWDYVSKK